MQFIDTHIHLQDFKADFAPPVLDNPAARRFITVSAQAADFAKAATLAKAYPDKVVPAFGVHPWHWRAGADTEEVRDYLRQFPNALVGEIGVDGLKEPPNEEQAQLFAAQLEIAREFARPVIVHAARAFPALTQFENALKKVKFVHHGFVKNRELIKFINKTGGYFGLGAHFLKQEKAVAMLAEMPKNKILFETDAPYQLREETYNQTVQENLAKLAVISGLSAAEIEELLIQNAEDFLKC